MTFSEAGPALHVSVAIFLKGKLAEISMSATPKIFMMGWFAVQGSMLAELGCGRSNGGTKSQQCTNLGIIPMIDSS